MILYLETSGLVKLFIEEEASEAVRDWVAQARVVATSRVAFAEAMAALARRYREGDLTGEGFTAARRALAGQWQNLAVVNLNEIAAGSLAVRHGLRGFDAIHLAAALDLLAGVRGIPVNFASFDRSLAAAARDEGLEGP